MARAHQLRNKFFNLSVILTIPLFIFLIVPIGFVIFTPFLIFRLILVYILAPVFRRDLRKVLTLNSSLFAAEDIYSPGSYSLMCGFLVEGDPSLEKFREEFTHKILNKKDPNTGALCYPEFQQNITHWFGYPFWRDLTKFNLSECIRELPENELNEFVGSNSDKVVSSWDCNSVEDKMQIVTAKPWTKDKPLWEIFFIRKYTNLEKLQVDNKADELSENKDSNNDKKFTLILIRVHHAFADGISAVMVFSQAMNVSLEEYTERYKARPAQNSQSRLVQFLKLLFLPLLMAYDVIYFLRKDDAGCKNPFRVSEKDFNNKQRNNILHTASSDPIDKALIKRIASHYKVSFSAVVFHAISSGIRSALIQKQGDKLPEKINVWLPLPVPNHPDKPRNWISLGLISLPMKNPDPVGRLLSIHRKLERLKNSTTLFSIFYLSKLHGIVPRWIGHELRKIKNSAGFISTLPGPSKTLSIGGFPVVKILFSASAIPGTTG